VRWLRVMAGLSRVAWLAAAALPLLYVLDRWLALPLPVRALLLALVAALLGREAWRRVARPLFRGPARLDAARLLERHMPSLEGRLISALQLGGGADGSMEQRVLDEASALCRERDLRVVLTARPSLVEVARAAGGVAALALLVVLARPHTDVFLRRWTLHDVPWPRDTRLSLVLAQRGPGHVLLEDGTLVAARGGSVEAQASLSGKDPGRVELVVEGGRGERASTMAGQAHGGWHGHASIERDDTRLRVRGGDDVGDDNALTLRVVEPPRLDQPQFRLVPPAYLGQPERSVGPEGLAVPEGTSITVSGATEGEVTGGELRLAGRADPVPLGIDTSTSPPTLSATFVADASDSLSIVLTGAYGLQTPDPSHLALLVERDLPPTLRVFEPARSDLKVTAHAVVPVGVIAEDDHGVVAVTLETTDGKTLPLAPDAERPTNARLLLDLGQPSAPGAMGYKLVASDGRELPGRGPQTAVADGRRIDVVDESEVQRLLADRQLRLKEAFKAIRERQASAQEAVGVLAAAPPAADDPELVAAVVAQNQVTSRLTRELRELCGVTEDTILNRLDPGPGAAAVLERRIADWRGAPVDESFSPVAWRALSADYTAGKFGRLDLVGRLLDMAGVAIGLEQDLSPQAHKLLTQARGAPDKATLAAAMEAQGQVLAGLDQLLGRMDEWEDYQEVLLLVKTLIDDQQSLRTRTQSALSGTRGPN